MTSEIESFTLENELFPNNVVSCIGGREENQDSCGITQTERGLLVLVCDGMGGMAGGALIKAIQFANQQLLAYTEEHPELKGMGTTVTALLINETKATVAHVGDSRIYQLRGRKKVFRTFDHSMVFEMVKNKVITEEQARLSAQSNIILRAVGLKEELDVEARDLSYKKGDRFFLCTDGIWGTMPEKDLIHRISQHQHPKVITESLAMFVNGEGKKQGSHHDNLSAALVFTTAHSTYQEKKGFFDFLFH